MPAPGSDLESRLAEFASSYIDASHDGQSPQNEDALHWVCAGLARLLGALLDVEREWHGWVDDVFPATDLLSDAVVVSSDTELSVRGLAIWAKYARDSPFWKEPFFGWLRISKEHDAIVSYRINFADAGRNLAEFPSDKHIRRIEWFYPAEWRFVLTRDGEAGLDGSRTPDPG